MPEESSYNVPSKAAVGRERELDFLEDNILVAKNHCVAIVGNRAIGKTSLWSSFIHKHSIKFSDKVEVIHMSRADYELPEFRLATDLVVIEDIDYSLSEHSFSQIEHAVNTNLAKQFILVGTNSEYLSPEKFGSVIQLSPLTNEASSQLLLARMGDNLKNEDLNLLVRYSAGNPLILEMSAHYLMRDNSVEDIYRLLQADLNEKGIVDRFGNELASDSHEYLQIVTDIGSINTSLLKKVLGDPSKVYDLTPRQFEELVAEMMIRMGYSVDLTPETRDGGKDILVASHTDLGNFLYYVECKKFAPNNPVGVKLVRELAGTVSSDRVTAGILVTSSYFTRDAEQFSEKTRHRMSLVDFIRLKEWMKKVRRNMR